MIQYDMMWYDDDGDDDDEVRLHLNNCGSYNSISSSSSSSFWVNTDGQSLQLYQDSARILNSIRFSSAFFLPFLWTGLDWTGLDWTGLINWYYMDDIKPQKMGNKVR